MGTPMSSGEQKKQANGNGAKWAVVPQFEFRGR
jgi:hypothetical protein